MANRTLFYPKRLVGQGSEQVQSLRSYLEHLALAHNMKPRAMLETLFATYPVTQHEAAIPTLLKRCSVHGNAALGPELRERLELATGCSLEEAGLWRFSRLLAPTNLARNRTMYCPCCVQEGEELPYIRLLWVADCVTACPIHGVRFRADSECGAPATERLPLQKRPSLGGVCTQCGSVGFRCVTETPESASVEEIAVARQVARLLGLPKATTDAFTPESLRAGLKQLVSAVYGGSVVRASREAGLSRASVCTWAAGGRPGLPWLVQLCLHAGADVVQLLGGSYSPLDDQSMTGKQYDVMGRTYNFAQTDNETVRQLLREAAREANPPSLREFARRHGLHIDTPKKRFPAEARALAEVGRAHLKRIRQMQYEEAVASYTRAAQALQGKGLCIHERSVQQESGVVAFSQNASRVRALQSVLSRFRAHEDEETVAAA